MTEIATLPRDALESLAPLLVPRMTRYIRHTPEPKQQAFLLINALEAFYGGAAGGMKSDTLLMAALQYVDIPGYNALLLRDTYANLNKPEGLMDRAHSWLKNTDAHWNGDVKRYEFPHRATLSFGYLDGPLDHHNFQGAEYQFVGIDEVVSIRENQALYLFSRLRIKEPESYRDELRELTNFTNEQIDAFYGAYKNIPLRFRCASNPPTAEQLVKGAWVKERYVDARTRQGVFIPASLLDNPHIDHDKYIESLDKLDPITRRQLKDGDWEIRVQDRFFVTSNISFVEEWPESFAVDIVRRWDMAATEKKQGQREESGPAYTVGVKGAIVDNVFYVLDIVRERMLPGDADNKILETAKLDTVKTRQTCEQEPGSSGKRDMYHIANLLKGYSFQGIPSTGSKIERARPLASWVNLGKVAFVVGDWNKDAIEELRLWPDGKFKDIGDAMAGCYSDLALSHDAAVSDTKVLEGMSGQFGQFDDIYG